VLEMTAHDGDFAKRHLINPALLRMLGDLTGRRVLDAGCGNGYLSRMLADRGALVVGVEPGRSLFDFAVEQETVTPQGIRYVEADLCALPDLGAPFDAVVASMVCPPSRTGSAPCAPAFTRSNPAVCSCSPSTTHASNSCGRPGVSTGGIRPAVTWPSTRSRPERRRLPPHHLDLPRPARPPRLPGERSRRTEARPRGRGRRPRGHRGVCAPAELPRRRGAAGSLTPL